MSTTYQDRIPVEVGGEEVEVFNHVTVPQEHYVNAINGYETFHGPVQAGDGGIGQPDAVTRRVANLLLDEFNLDVRDQGIDVIDLDAEDVVHL